MLVVVLGVWWGESSLDLFWGKQKEMSTWNSPQHADERGLPEWLSSSTDHSKAIESSAI